MHEVKRINTENLFSQGSLMPEELSDFHEEIESIAGKYLTFNLGDEGYGLEILKVQEIIGMQEITKIPKTPEYVKGIINLRGKVIPVVDLRLKFGMQKKEHTHKTCILVTQVGKAENSLTLGVVVDEVSEVLNIAKDQIEPPPSFGSHVDTHFILGMAKDDSQVKILLDIDKVFSADELHGMNQKNQQAC